MIENTFYESVQSVHFGANSLVLEYRFAHRNQTIAYDQIEDVQMIQDLPRMARILGERDSHRKVWRLEVRTTQGNVTIDAGNDRWRVRALKEVHRELLERI